MTIKAELPFGFLSGIRSIIGPNSGLKPLQSLPSVTEGTRPFLAVPIVPDSMLKQQQEELTPQEGIDVHSGFIIFSVIKDQEIKKIICYRYDSELPQKFVDLSSQQLERFISDLDAYEQEQENIGPRTKATISDIKGRLKDLFSKPKVVFESSEI